ncbi:DUF3309 domain-containing protein [Parvibaculum sp.]|uniref:DUF3309 domain-containing protein n=1 Tax=Parvibaculum sp. TaxID=2024848 RepID=UPI0034A08823
MGTGTIVLFALLLLLIGVLPRWAYSANWGYFPSSSLSAVMLVVHFMILTQRF